MNLWFEFTPKECTSKCLYTGGYPNDLGSGSMYRGYYQHGEKGSLRHGKGAY